MHSSGHRRNLLDPRVDSVGISVFEQEDIYVPLKTLVERCYKFPSQGQEGSVSSVLAGSGITVLPPTNDARQTCRMERG